MLPWVFAQKGDLASAHSYGSLSVPSSAQLGRHDGGFGAGAAEVSERELAVVGADQAVALGELDDVAGEN